jgi:hypothetical protein
MTIRSVDIRELRRTTLANLRARYDAAASRRSNMIHINYRES